METAANGKLVNYNRTQVSKGQRVLAAVWLKMLDSLMEGDLIQQKVMVKLKQPDPGRPHC